MIGASTSGVNSPIKGNSPQDARDTLRIRASMSPAEKAKYDRNPAIAALGIDVVPRLTEELIDRCKVVNFGDVRRDDAARQKAIVTKPFTGNPPWRKWLPRYQSNCLANGYTNRQALLVLKGGLIGTTG